MIGRIASPNRVCVRGNQSHGLLVGISSLAVNRAGAQVSIVVPEEFHL